MSAADDGIVRLWDISHGEKISDLPVHSGKISYCMSHMNYTLVVDYCRAGETVPNDPNIFCSGGYDNMINVPIRFISAFFYLLATSRHEYLSFHCHGSSCSVSKFDPLSRFRSGYIVIAHR